MTEVQIESMEETAAFKFEGWKDNLDDLPTNEDIQNAALNEGVWMRACAVLLQFSDEELFAKIKDDETADWMLDFAEHLGEFIEAYKADISRYECCQARLLVCLSRYADTMEDRGAS